MLYVKKNKPQYIVLLSNNQLLCVNIFGIG